MIEKKIITKDGQKDLKEELKHLIDIERPKIIETIKEARQQGDLSDNAEFEIAREKQGQIEDRIQEIQNILENSEIVKQNKTSEDKISIGSIVEYLDFSTNKINKVQIVDSLEADPFENKISKSSPIGHALLDAKIGEQVVIPVEKKYKIEIKSIKSN